MGYDVLSTFFFSLLTLPAEILLNTNHRFCFWTTVVVAFYFVSPLAAALVITGSAFTWFATFGHGPCSLPRYVGEVDVTLGRLYRASTVTSGMPSNNNVTIAAFKGQLVIAYRKADSHFASPLARLLVATASPRDLENWEVTWQHHTGEDDLREMILLEHQDKMFLYFARLAPFKRGFSPRYMQWTCSEDLKVWQKPMDFGRESEIIWDIKTHETEAGGKLVYKVSYSGNHYGAAAELTIHFEQSADGIDWKPVGKDSAVYVGGVSEVSFAFTPAGDLVAVGRNEDGDRTGFGTQLFFGSKHDLGTWTPLGTSLPHRFDSPRLLCIDGELLLFARFARETFAAAPSWLPFEAQRVVNMGLYSLLPKGAAVYSLRLPGPTREWRKQPLELVRCFENSHGDTGFFSVVKPEASDDWFVANYSSSCHSHAPWIYGQVFATDVYVCRCHVLRR